MLARQVILKRALSARKDPNVRPKHASSVEVPRAEEVRRSPDRIADQKQKGRLIKAPFSNSNQPSARRHYCGVRVMSSNDTVYPLLLAFFPVTVNLNK